MQISTVFIAVSLAGVAVALPAPLSKDVTLDLKSSKIMARAPAEKTKEMKDNKGQKCWIDSCAGFLDGGGFGGGSSWSKGAFSRSSFSSQQTFVSGSSLSWGGISNLGFTGTSAWKNNFIGAGNDLGIFINNFGGMFQAFQSSQFSWSNVQGAILSFGRDFSTLCNQLSSFNAFGSFSSGLQTFQSYFVQCIQTFQSFFQSIRSRFGGDIFQQSNIFGSFQTGLQSLFRIASQAGIDCYNVLQSSQIDFGLFQQCGMPLQSWIGGGSFGGGGVIATGGSSVVASGSSSSYSAGGGSISSFGGF